MSFSHRVFIKLIPLELGQLYLHVRQYNTIKYKKQLSQKSLSSFAGHSLGVGLPSWFRQTTLRGDSLPAQAGSQAILQ